MKKSVKLQLNLDKLKTLDAKEVDSVAGGGCPNSAGVNQGGTGVCQKTCTLTQ